MRSMTCSGFGGVEVFICNAHAAIPPLGPRDVLVRVQTTSVNPVDIKIRKGGYPIERRVPYTLGFDVAGVVESVGMAVSEFAPGDRVMGSPDLSREGANAEYVAIDAGTLVRQCKGLTPHQAAALPLVALTAWGVLHQQAHLSRGETVLVVAGAGGVGHMTIQMARHAGCRVIATASRDESMALCRELGADHVVNHHDDDVVQQVRNLTDGWGVDVVCQYGPVASAGRWMDTLGVYGRFVSIVPLPENAPVNNLFRIGGSLHYEFMGIPNLPGQEPRKLGAMLMDICTLIHAGALKPHISKVWNLEDIAQAHQAQEAGHVMGKQVIHVSD